MSGFPASFSCECFVRHPHRGQRLPSSARPRRGFLPRLRRLDARCSRTTLRWTTPGGSRAAKPGDRRPPAAHAWSSSASARGACASPTSDAWRSVLATTPSVSPKAPATSASALPQTPRRRAATAGSPTRSRPTKPLHHATMRAPAGSALRMSAPKAARAACARPPRAPAQTRTVASRRTAAPTLAPPTQATAAMPACLEMQASPRPPASIDASSASPTNVAKQRSSVGSEPSARRFCLAPMAAPTPFASTHVGNRTRPEGRVRWSFRAARSRAAGRRADCELERGRRQCAP